MNILIPVDSNEDVDEAQITLLDEAKYWLLQDFSEGRVHKSEFFATKEEITDWIDVVIIKNNAEYVWPFMEQGTAVLVAPMQLYVEDIMEAFLFKELHELNG
ncbi:MAG: hypothetical protein U9R16_06605 [Campylobacterota bacterium]|nr:hypothetical protein [Campylobacterota bacterium]